MILTAATAYLILVDSFIILVLSRVPVALALGIATIPVVALDLRLTSVFDS